MQYFAIDTDWDESLNSPWDALWHEGEYDALGCLDGSLPLKAIWKSPEITLESRDNTPDVYSFELHYAVNERTRNLIAPIVKDEAEFLPLNIPEKDTAYVIHPLWPVDFDDQAEVHCNAVSKNITVVHKYSFTLDPREFDGPRHLFRMRQAKGSAARDDGSTLKTLIVSETIRDVCEGNAVEGITFKPAHTT